MMIEDEDSEYCNRLCSFCPFSGKCKTYKEVTENGESLFLWEEDEDDIL